jgi:hypothetical protein
MNRYRQNLPAATTLHNPPVQPTPVAGGKAPPTQFKVERSVYVKKASQTFTVKAEYQKYAAGEISSEETNILKFWEV